MTGANKLSTDSLGFVFFPPSIWVEKIPERSRITNNQMFKLFTRKQKKSNYFWVLWCLSTIPFYVFCFQLKKQFPTMNLKIPAKRIFGDNFDPGKLLSCYSFCQFLYMNIDLFQPTRSYLGWVLHQSSKQWLNESLVMLQSRTGTSVGRYSALWWWAKNCLVAQCLPCTEAYTSSQPSHVQDCERLWTVRCNLSSTKVKAKTHSSKRTPSQF